MRPINSSKVFSYKWQVQPYRWLAELRANYLHAVCTASKYDAYREAEAATIWMKENAPWKDKTGTARKSLEAWVEEGKQQAEAEGIAAKDLQEAQRKDRELLQYLNETAAANLIENETAKIERLLARGKISEEEASEMRFNIRDAKPITYLKVSAEDSYVTALFAKQNQPQRKTFLFQVHFHYNLNPKIYRYILWLEIANGGRYSIIGPAYNYWSRRFIGKLKSLSNLKPLQGQFTTPELPLAVTSPSEAFAQYVPQATKGRKFAGTKSPYSPFDLGIKEERAYRKRYRHEKAEEARTGVKRKRTSRNKQNRRK